MGTKFWRELESPSGVTVGTDDWEIIVGVAVDITVGGTLVVTTVRETVVITVDGTMVVTVGRIAVITVRAVKVTTVGDCVAVVRTGAWWSGLSVQGGQSQSLTSPRENMDLRADPGSPEQIEWTQPLAAATLNKSSSNLTGADGALVFGVC